MLTSDTLSRLQNITDTPDNKDVSFHFTPNYIEHAYSHLVENLYAHKMKSLDTSQVKRKHGRPPKAKLENTNSHLNSTTAATTHTTRPCKATKTLDNDIASRELVRKINEECEMSDRLTVAKLNNVGKPYKQDYKPKLMTEKYSLLPINPGQLTPVQTALQRLSENHPDFGYNLLTPSDPRY